MLQKCNWGYTQCLYINRYRSSCWPLLFMPIKPVWKLHDNNEMQSLAQQKQKSSTITQGFWILTDNRNAAPPSAWSSQWWMTKKSVHVIQDDTVWTGLCHRNHSMSKKHSILVIFTKTTWFAFKNTKHHLWCINEIYGYTQYLIDLLLA